MQPPAVDRALVDNLRNIVCPLMAKNMTPNLRQKVWKNPESSDDEEARPPLVGGDDSPDDELIEDQGVEV